MAEETEQKDEATTPEPEINAASILAELSLESEESDESKAEQADEDKTEDKTEEDDEKEDSQELDNEDEEDNELDLEAKLALDPKVADKLPKEEQERYAQQVKGLAKLERQLAERDNDVGWKTYQGVEAALFNMGPEQAQKVLAEITKAVEDHHKISKQEETQEPVESGDSWQYDGKTFYSLSEIELYKENQAIKAEIAEIKNNKDPLLEELRAEREAEKVEKARSAWVDSNSQKIIAKVAAKTGGWGVTKEQIAEVAKADKALLESDPVKALKREFPDAWGEYTAKGTKKAPRDMISNSEAKGFVVPENPDEYSAKHALMEIS